MVVSRPLIESAVRRSLDDDDLIRPLAQLPVVLLRPMSTLLPMTGRPSYTT